MAYQLHCGDNLAYLRTMADNSVKCLRVLKPGGRLLTFAATRTYHRMACAWPSCNCGIAQ